MNDQEKDKPTKSIVKRITKLLKMFIVIIIVLVIGFFLLVNFFNAPNKGSVDDANKAKCETIIRALSSYFRDTGRYPENLDELTPNYVATLPLEVMYDGDPGKPFDYSVENNGSVFSLKYNEASMGTLPSDGYFEYRSDSGSWDNKLW